MMCKRVLGRAFGLALGGAGLFCVSPVHGQTMRIVNWNIEADLNKDATGTFAGTGVSGGGIVPITTVLQAIGSLSISHGTTTVAQPIDVLALEEVGADSAAEDSKTMPAVNALPSAVQMNAIVGALNNIYGKGAYAYVNVANSTSGGEGGGPSALIYNTKTVSSVSATNLATGGGYYDSSEPYRSPMQFQITPTAYATNPAGQFYVDVSHMKSGTDGVDNRNVEAGIITGSSAVTNGSHVISVGDFNITSGSSEASYQTMITKFKDVGDPGQNWEDTDDADAYLQSEKGYYVEYRDDLQFGSASAVAGSGSTTAGLQYDSGSYRVFGNFGSTSLYHKNVNTQSGNYTFAGLTTSQNTAENAAVLTALGGDSGSGTTDADKTAASDHLPIVADYDFVGLPEPSSGAMVIFGVGLYIRRRRR